MVYDGVDKRIYVNGVLDAATPQAQERPDRCLDSGRPSGHARRSRSVSNGLIDDVRIYDRALPATEIEQLTTIAVTPDGAALGNGQTQQYVASGADQFGEPYAFDPSWSASGGSITSEGLYTAGPVVGDFGVTAEHGLVADSAACHHHL